MWGREKTENDPLLIERLIAMKEQTSAILQLAYAMNNLAASIDRHATPLLITDPTHSMGYTGCSAPKSTGWTGT